MSPFFSHLENADMAILASNGRLMHYDPQSQIHLNGLSIILSGQISNKTSRKGPGSVLGLDNWILKDKDLQIWKVTETTTLLVSELPDEFLEDWSIPIAVSLVDERATRTENEISSNIEMASLRFQHLKRMVLLNEDN